MIVPALRFPEFVNLGEWQEKTLGSICSNIASGKDKVDDNGEFDLYGSTGVIGKTNCGSYQGNFILVARVGANAGFLNRVNGKFGVTDNTLVIFLDESEDFNFVYHALEKIGLNKLVFGSGQPLITGGQLKNLTSYFPKPAEQQKIASCLSSLDDLITAHTQKLDALKAHKKGLMQQLFPAEGEKVPKLRFKEFKDSGEWEEKTIGDYYKNLGTGMTPSRLYPEYFIGDIPWITSGELNHGLVTDTKEKLTEEAVKKTNLKLYKPGTFFIAITGLEAPGTRGKCAINGVFCTTNQSCMAFEEIPNVSTKFLFHWYRHNSEDLFSQAHGTKQQSFNNSTVAKFKFVHPTIVEQQKIAACLSSLDELITAQAEKIAQLKLHKKGLMQGLFPAVKENN